MKNYIIAIALCLALQGSALAVPPTPFNSTRSYNNSKSSTTYFQRNGSIAGRSYTTNGSTYWRDNKGQTLGRSYTTPSGNTYYFGK